jgi:hypothetical protein
MMLLWACSAETPKEPPCGAPSVVWTPSEKFKYPHHSPIHLVEVNHEQQVLLNGDSISDAELIKSLKEIGKEQYGENILFDFDAHADCKIVKSARKMVESSGVCGGDGICIDGDAVSVPPKFVPNEAGQMEPGPR